MDNLFVGNSLIHLTEVDSTNSYANALLKDVKPPEGTIIWADQQIAGRGMRGNIWTSEILANITCSVVLYPKFLNASNHFLLSKAVALAIHGTLADLLNLGNNDIKIKWPNDILIGGKKIAGVLIEHIFKKDEITASVVGIGLNVNQEQFGELNDKATSMKILSGKDFDRKEVLLKLAKYIEVFYLKIKYQKHFEINTLYLNELLYHKEEFTFVIKENGQKRLGEIVSVHEDGRIEIADDTGQVRLYDMKEIAFGY